MQNISLAVLLLALVSVCSVGAIPAASYAEASSNQALMKYLLKPQSFVVGPAVSAQCFNLYVPILNNIANTFSVQYQACITLANQRVQSLNAQAAANQTDFIQQVGDVCTAYQNCDDGTDVLAFFNCYASVSNQDVSVVYNVGIEASSAANALSQGLQNIQNDQDQCTNTTEQTYISDTASTYTMLDDCLDTGLPDVGSTTLSTGSTVSDDITDTPETTEPASGTGTTQEAVTVA